MMSTHKETVLASLAAEALAANPLSLPGAVEKAKTCLIDFLSCAFESRNLQWAEQAIGLATCLPRGANILASEVMCSPSEAAFANAVLGHGLVREDMHAGSIAHLGVVVWPPLLALAQRSKVSGEALLAAALVGYETGARIGRVLMTSELARLYRPTGIVGPIAGAIAGARLLGFDADQAANAVSLAVNTSSGLNQWPHNGGSEMYFHPGFASRNAITCIELAEAGAVASRDIIEGEAGLFAAFARRPFNGAVALFPDGEAEILNVFNKPVPACNYAQTPCQAALQVARETGFSRRIRQVLIEASEAALLYPGCDATGPYARALQAKMSIQFGVAATLSRGAIAEENYSLLDDTEISRLIGVTTLKSDPAYTAAYPAKQGARVSVTLDDGSIVSHQLEDVVFATPEFVRSRFRDACAAVLGKKRARAIEAFVDSLEDQTDAGQLAALCAIPANHQPTVGHA